jgi:hypothetical protein
MKLETTADIKSTRKKIKMCVKVQSDELRNENKFDSDSIFSAFHNSFLSKQKIFDNFNKK